ncbi:MAG: HAD family hydrolase [Planctomycetaceae bacterium]|nr:HAD family hydrolase [Planctomycetaceae bacterium]
MWSGPRNISTAMMRAWGTRPDTFVCDEPFYAHYLKVTGKLHPGAAEVIAGHESDWHKVTAWLTGEIPLGRAVFYQKQMTHHFLPEIDRNWLGSVSNCFLIRHPQEVIASYIAKNDDPSLEDVGFVQQVEIFDLVCRRTGSIPPVLDGRDVQNDPRRLLGLLCDSLGVAFDECMLQWPPGLRPTDGVWARHWYKEVESSTSFRPHKPKAEPVPDRLRDVYEKCLECYERMSAHRLR